ncbi:MAG: hypothetical protein ABIC40_05630, partial [bacterium]
CDTAYSSPIYHDHTYTGINYYGYNQIFYDFIVGCESNLNSNAIWMLEDGDYYASRWLLQESPNALVYNNAYFGTGYQTDDDDGFYMPQDITRDDTNRYFVLDKLSTGDPSIKVWTISGDTTTSIGSFGNTTTINGDPLRIEGSDFDDKIVVLHGSAAPYKISVFGPYEMPPYI